MLGPKSNGPNRTNRHDGSASASFRNGEGHSHAAGVIQEDATPSHSGSGSRHLDHPSNIPRAPLPSHTQHTPGSEAEQGGGESRRGAQRPGEGEEEEGEGVGAARRASVDVRLPSVELDNRGLKLAEPSRVEREVWEEMVRPQERRRQDALLRARQPTLDSDGNELPFAYTLLLRFVSLFGYLKTFLFICGVSSKMFLQTSGTTTSLRCPRRKRVCSK